MDLEIGRFYWVEPVYCGDIEDSEEWKNGLQPARYEGDNKFNFMGNEESWPARYVGKEVNTN